MSEQKEIVWRTEFHKALSNPVRLEIVDLLAKGELCQCDIFPKIGSSQSTVSSYLQQLVRAGILTVRRDGTRKLYSINDRKIQIVLTKLHQLANDMIE